MADESRTVGDGQEEQAMSDTEPLSDARLAEIRASIEDTAGSFRPLHYLAVVDLLAEVERLRASPPPRPLDVEALARELARMKGWSLRIWTVARAEGAERIVEIARRAHEAWQTGATDAGSPAIDGIMVDLGVELGRATSPAPRSPHPKFPSEVAPVSAPARQIADPVRTPAIPSKGPLLKEVDSRHG